MSDKFSKEKRSQIMSKIRAKNTKPELIFKKAIKGTYLRYHPKVYGNPDFANKKRKIAIFIDGCFWHKCPKCYKAPKSNEIYWLPKIKRNVQRDKQVTKYLKKEGWTVIRFWEHQIKYDKQKCLNKILNT